MSLWSGAVKIDAVYLGGGGSGSTAWVPVAQRGAGLAGRSGTASFSANYAGDLLVMVLSDSATSTPQNPPAGWTRYPTWLSSSGLGNNFYSAIYYKFATAPQTMQSITGCDWLTLSFSGVNKTTPFGAYAQQENASTRNHNAPAITAQQTNGNASVLHLYCTKGASGSWTNSATAGDSLVMTDTQWNQWATMRIANTLASVPAQPATTSNSQPSFAHTIELLPDSRAIESGMAQAVFLGDIKVWPEFTAAETRYFTAGNHAYTVPTGASYIDVVSIGGGGGGDGSLGGATANGRAGACGQWDKFSLAVGVDIQPGEVIGITVGAGGQGGTALVPGASANGGTTTVKYRTTNGQALGGGKAAMPGMVGGSGTLTYNGRTYNTGAGGAAGSGASGNGGPGTAPGAGGGGGLSTLSSSAGGAGAAGGVWVYAY